MRARTLLGVALAAALAGCGASVPTGGMDADPEAAGTVRRETAPDTAADGGTQSTGYLGSGNRGDTTTVTPAGAGG